MPIKCCEVCNGQFMARLSRIRTCSVECRNRLIAKEKEDKGRHAKACEVCSKEFEVTASNAGKQTCSGACATELRVRDRRTQTEMKCATCGDGFLTRLALAESGVSKYCSKQCQYDRNKSDTARKCECCGTEFSTPPSQMHVRTCSVECGYKIRSSPQKKEKISIKCAHCGVVFEDHESRAGSRTYCSRSCTLSSESLKEARSSRFSGEGNPGWLGGTSVQSISSTGNKYRRSAPHIENEKNTRRKRVRDLATPVWGSLDKVKEIYRRAREISELTGVVHHVDHIVPLTSDKVSGLHNEFNLRVIPGEENLRKHNRSWPDMW